MRSHRPHIVHFILIFAFAAAARAEPLVQLQRVPDGGIQPQVAVDEKGVVHLIYFKGDATGGDVHYIKSSDAGATWSRPLRVNSQAGSVVAAGNIRGAQLAVGKAGRVHVAWMGSKQTWPGDQHMKAPMLYARLSDAGDGFESQRNVIAQAYGLDGGGSVAADEKGGVYVVWHAGSRETGGEEGRRIYVSRSSDEGKTFAAEKPADTGKLGACACCGLRALAESRSLLVVYRNADTKSDRDMTLLVSRDRGESFASSVVDVWKVQTCPMSLPAIHAGAVGVMLAWEAAQGRVEFAALDAAGKIGRVHAAPKFKDAPTSPQKYPVLTTDSAGRVLLAWTEGMGWQRGGAAAWQVYDKAGNPTAGEGGLKFGVPAWSLIAAFTRPDGGFVVLY